MVWTFHAAFCPECIARMPLRKDVAQHPKVCPRTQKIDTTPHSCKAFLSFKSLSPSFGYFM